MAVKPVGGSAKVEAQLMRPGEVVEARRRAPVAFLAIGPLEWHGPHLPMGVDGLHAHHVAAGVARTVGGIVLPPLFVGADSVQGPGTGESIEHLGVSSQQRVMGMDYPGNSVRSGYVDEGVVGLLVRELVRALKRDPYDLIVIVNGHGAPGHQRVLQRVAVEENQSDGVKVLYVTAWTPPRPPASNPGHADRLETSILMALEPAAVDVSRLPPRPENLAYADFGIVDGAAFDGRPHPDLAVPDENDPRNASTDEGARILEREVQHVREIVLAALTATDRTRLQSP